MNKAAIANLVASAAVIVVILGAMFMTYGQFTALAERVNGLDQRLTQYHQDFVSQAAEINTRLNIAAQPTRGVIR